MRGKFFIFSGVLLCFFVLTQFYKGAWSLSDVIHFSQGLVGNEAPAANTEEILDTSADSVVLGAIISPNLPQKTKLNAYFKELAGKKKIKNFIILGSEGQKLVFHIEKYFPDAEIIFSNSAIAEKFQKDVFWIAALDFGRKLDNNILAFHDELARNVIHNLEFENGSKLDIPEPEPLAQILKLARKNQQNGLNVVVNEREHAVVNQNSYFIFDLVSGPEEKNLQPDRDLTILAFGDMMLGRYVRSLMDQNGEDYIFAKIFGENKNFFQGADVVFGNLEGPIKANGYRNNTGMVFGFPDSTAGLLKKYGFNLLSIANNHATDQGWDGRGTTIAALDKSGIGWCGHPSEADEKSIYYRKIGYKKAAFLCFQDVTYPLNVNAAVELIKKVRPNVDYLIVSAHWGYEYKHYPDFAKQVDPGRKFVDAGADLIIGHHPHVVQTFEIYKGKPVFYSLGNFVFDQYWSVATQEELALGIVLDDSAGTEDQLKSKIYLFPMKSEKSQSRLMQGEQRQKWLEEFIGYGQYNENMKNQIRNGVIVY